MQALILVFRRLHLGLVADNLPDAAPGRVAIDVRLQGDVNAVDLSGVAQHAGRVLPGDQDGMAAQRGSGPVRPDLADAHDREILVADAHQETALAVGALVQEVLVELLADENKRIAPEPGDGEVPGRLPAEADDLNAARGQVLVLDGGLAQSDEDGLLAHPFAVPRRRHFLPFVANGDVLDDDGLGALDGGHLAENLLGQGSVHEETGAIRDGEIGSAAAGPRPGAASG